MPLDRTAVKRGLRVSVFVALACTAASCVGPNSTISGPRCGFADPEVTTSMGIYNLVAEYYVAHGEWPLTKAKLEEQHSRLLEQVRAQMSAEEVQKLSHFLDRFTLLDLRKSGEDLVFHYRFKIRRKTTDLTVTFRPRPTVDEIFEAATANGYD